MPIIARMIVFTSNHSTRKNDVMIVPAALPKVDRSIKALFAELAPQGIRVTMLRACKMYDEDFTWNVPPERMKQFAEENEKRGWRPGKQAIARFETAGAQIRWLVNLPSDLAVPEVVLEARFA